MLHLVSYLLKQIDEDLLGDKLDYKNIDTQYKEMFIAGIKRGVERGLLDTRMANFDLKRLSISTRAFT
jgi:hypothetical protein